MPKKLGPYLLLLLLITVLVFILGVRTGEHVEKSKLPPTKPPLPTQPPLEFKTYNHKGCGISFLYPSYFKLEKDSSEEAKISDKNKFIAFSCGKTATAESTINPQYESRGKINPLTGKKIVFTLEKSLLPLLEKSLEFIK